jgi:hypothetical protein
LTNWGIYRLYLAGHDGQVFGMKAIATHLNRQGLTMRGRPWRIQKVNRLLADPLYAGCFYFNRRDSRTRKERPQPDWIVVSVPAIIDAGIFERVAKRRASCDPKAVPPRVVSSPAPLVGLLKCGDCGAGMTQATGKSGQYRYYKCTTRLAKNVDACMAKNLPREQTDALVLGALSERVFTPKRVSLMLNELLHHQQQKQTAEDARPITLRKELDRATTGLDRLYQAVEDGALSIDETLQTRAQERQAMRWPGDWRKRDEQCIACARSIPHCESPISRTRFRFAERNTSLGGRRPCERRGYPSGPDRMLARPVAIKSCARSPRPPRACSCSVLRGTRRSGCQSPRR